MNQIPIQLSNRRYERFCREYTVDRNASQAYIRAGYAPNGSNASRLLNQLEIQIRIAQLDHEVFHKVDVTNERIIEEYAKLAFAEMVDVYIPGTRMFKNFEDMPDDVRAAIESLETCPITGKIIKLKMATKKGALDSLAKIKNMFQDHKEAGSGEINIIMDEKDLKA